MKPITLVIIAFVLSISSPLLYQQNTDTIQDYITITKFLKRGAR